MIQCGIRRNLRYPILFIVFTLIRRVIKFIMEYFFLKNVKLSYLTISFMIFFEFILGNIYSCIYQSIDSKDDKSKSKTKNDTNKKDINKIKIIQNKNKDIKRPDHFRKIFLLMFFSAYFEFIGFLSRRLITIKDSNNNYDEFNAKYRSIEILISSLLCYFTLRINIYRHHIFSLIIIIISLIIVFLYQFLNEFKHYKTFLYEILNVCTTSITRAFLDTTEKYLFDMDYINIFKLIRFQGFINIILMSILYIFDKPRKEIINLIKLSNDNYWHFWNPIIVVILLIIYAILSGYKNIFRRYTIKEYSPMSRALAESIIDPFLIIFGFIEDMPDDNFYICAITICSVIMVFSSCIYNEVFILYCCKLEDNTYKEISRRAKLNSIRNETLISIGDKDKDSV